MLAKKLHYILKRCQNDRFHGFSVHFQVYTALKRTDAQVKPLHQLKVNKSRHFVSSLKILRGVKIISKKTKRNSTLFSRFLPSRNPRSLPGKKKKQWRRPSMPIMASHLTSFLTSLTLNIDLKLPRSILNR